jgi:hypothetical protein
VEIKIFNNLFGKSEVKELLGMPRHKWEDDIKIYASKVGCEDVDWIQVAQDRVQ